MNCPQCKQPVGSDQYVHLKWEDEIDSRGNVVGFREPVAIYCSHCGIFEFDIVDASLVDSGRICNLRGPITNKRSLKRLEELIPACQADRRIPA